MNKTELQAKATELGVEFVETDTKADLVAKIDAATGTNELLSDPANLADDPDGTEPTTGDPASGEGPDVPLDLPSVNDGPGDDLDGDDVIDSGFSMDEHQPVNGDPGVGEILDADVIEERAYAPDDPELYLRHLGLHAEADALPPYQANLRSDDVTPIDS